MISIEDIPNNTTQLAIDVDVAALLTNAALIDDSSKGKIQVTGADRLDLLHRISTNDVLRLEPYSSIGTTFITDKGRIVDYIRVLVLPNSLFLITSPRQEERLKDWIGKYTIMEDIQLKVVTSDFSMYSVIGPSATQRIASVFSDLAKPNQLREIRYEENSVVLDRQNDFGVDSICVVVPAMVANEVREKLLSGSENDDAIRMIGEQAVEYHRIRNGIPGESTELTSSFNPYEVNLRHSISFTKGCYIGQEVIARLDTYQKIQRILFRLSLDVVVPQSGLPVPVFKNSEQVGMLTSVTSAPFKGNYTALAVLKKDIVEIGDTVMAEGSSFSTKATVTNSFESNQK